MNTLVLRMLRATALLFALAGLQIPTAAEAAPLTLEAKVNGAWVRVLGTNRRNLLGVGPAAPQAIPETAPLRLAGELAEHVAELDITAEFDLVELAQPSESGLPPKYEARKIGFSYFEPLVDGTPEAHWKAADPARAVLVCAWQVDGHPVHVRAQPLVESLSGKFTASRINLPLAADETRGNPIFLLIENGTVLPVCPRLEDTEIGRAAVLANLGQDAAAAAIVDGLFPQSRSSELTNEILTDGLGEAKITKNSRDLLLLVCARAGAEATIASLLRHGAHPHAADQSRRTALHLAAQGGRLGTVTKLLAAGAPFDTSDNFGNTPLHYAALNAQSEICRLLLTAGAPLGVGNNLGQTPTLCALQSNCRPALGLFLSRQGTFDFEANGLERALIAKAGQGQRELVQILLRHKPRIDFLWQNQSALIAAAREGHLGVVEDLLAAKADPNAANADGLAPLLAAAGRGRHTVVQRILTAGANPRATTKSSATALQAACAAGSTESVKILLAAGVPSESPRPGDVSPLTLALAAGSREAADLLLAAGAKVNPTNPTFDSELSTALSVDADRYVSAAIQSGMPVTYTTAKGWSILRLARAAKAERCVALLSAAGAPETATNNLITPANKLEKAPQLLVLGKPTDPRAPEENDLESRTIFVEALIDQNGIPTLARATCPDCRLATSAISTVLSSKFTPGFCGGVPVVTQVRVPIRFAEREAFTFDYASLDKKPIPTVQVPPRYPEALKRQGTTGFAVVRFYVDADGSVQDIETVAASHTLLARSAIEAVRKWRFTPGMKDGKPVACRIQQEFPFLLR